MPSMTTEIIFEGQTTIGTEAVEVYSSTEYAPSEYDPSGEMQYLYVQSENVDGSFVELNELQERMYDNAEEESEDEIEDSYGY